MDEFSLSFERYSTGVVSQSKAMPLPTGVWLWIQEQRIKPGHRLRLLLCVPFRALTPMAGWQEGHPAHKNPVPLTLRGCLPE